MEDRTMGKKITEKKKIAGLSYAFGMTPRYLMIFF